VVEHPRFSKLAFAGGDKIGKLPPKSALVGFSAQQVYETAERVRRHHGGAAVVLGALSPRTRNAQVAMFQAGEVDYLVATDAIGMGLNLDIDARGLSVAAQVRWAGGAGAGAGGARRRSRGGRGGTSRTGRSALCCRR
jgi:ATP-dependent RNA helicase SUPV3L1/SUV3